ncbi:GntR family transcriptional regulator [Alicyclobacillus cycloheptanicus]|uniref:DNA-binding GntR family transcriptional regulator n=1 Tax=Alicyclobacillus cycloheptanicus TaxID=1457 RepID=A0ABT9XGZ9_9BACL|nr:GntR family transcriptional regulator [Alicyclobacillus cycloheptanicus]MDQ0189579.1 DNA-binding GntR family transcriptional regulator [Alicyclobacillus cycloheptanicus]WDM01632.1 GntR family transcriptional regulator [Alicyclobacillus cycloheptanicus]
MLNRFSGVPLYRQIRAQFEQKIRDGEWKPGDKIPTEEQLQRAYGVSRITVQRALRDLSIQGMLTRVAGKGTFVSAGSAEENLLEFINVLRNEPAMEGDHHVIGAGRQRPDKLIAARMDIAQTDEVFRLERIKVSNGMRVALETSFVPAALCPTLLDGPLESLILYEYFKAHGVHLADAKMYVQPILLGDEPASLLNMPSGLPVFQWERISYTTDGKVAELSRFVIRSDLQRFFVKYHV